MAISDILNEFDKYIINNIPRTNNKYEDTMASATSLMPIGIEDEEIIQKKRVKHLILLKMKKWGYIILLNTEVLHHGMLMFTIISKIKQFHNILT